MADTPRPAGQRPPVRPVREAPSAGWIIAATLLSVASVCALVVAGFRPPVSVIGWVLAGPVAVSLFVVYTRRERAARTADESAAASPNLLYWLGLSVMCAAIIVNALSVGLWLGAL